MNFRRKGCTACTITGISARPKDSTVTSKGPVDLKYSPFPQDKNSATFDEVCSPAHYNKKYYPEVR